MKTCAPFRAAYNAWRQGVIESTQAKLLQAAEAAASVVAQTLREGDGRFALSVLKYLQLGRGPTPGPTDLKLAADEVAILHEEERHVQHKRADAAGNDRLSPRRRESYEALVERVKERQREAAEEAAALKRPTPGGTSDR